MPNFSAPDKKVCGVYFIIILFYYLYTNYSFLASLWLGLAWLVCDNNLNHLSRSYFKYLWWVGSGVLRSQPNKFVFLFVSIIIAKNVTFSTQAFQTNLAKLLNQTKSKSTDGQNIIFCETHKMP